VQHGLEKAANIRSFREPFFPSRDGRSDYYDSGSKALKWDLLGVRKMNKNLNEDVQ
jgi:hypothetical protein